LAAVRVRSKKLDTENLWDQTKTAQSGKPENGALLLLLFQKGANGDGGSFP